MPGSAPSCQWLQMLPGLWRGTLPDTWQPQPAVLCMPGPARLPVSSMPRQGLLGPGPAGPCINLPVSKYKEQKVKVSSVAFLTPDLTPRHSTTRLLCHANLSSLRKGYCLHELANYISLPMSITCLSPSQKWPDFVDNLARSSLSQTRSSLTDQGGERMAQVQLWQLRG